MGFHIEVNERGDRRLLELCDDDDSIDCSEWIRADDTARALDALKNIGKYDDEHEARLAWESVLERLGAELVPAD